MSLCIHLRENALCKVFSFYIIRILYTKFSSGLTSIFCEMSLCVYGVATINRLLQIIGHFCKRALQKRLHSAKETYNSKKPAHQNHPIFHRIRSVRSVLVLYKRRISSGLTWIFYIWWRAELNFLHLVAGWLEFFTFGSGLTWIFDI